ncbi:MAG: 2-oxoglutarate dehydrogenase E1 component [Gammaproteobacteria bacterium]|nr:2-oxoglutarate dehydrogenase E1 component [Gammaproteobacteria bacterium]
MTDSHFLYSLNAPFIEQLYENYLNDPQSVTANWRDYFDQLAQEAGDRDRSHSQIRERLRESAFTGQQRLPATGGSTADREHDKKQVSVLQLINAHRFLGHRNADLDPLNQYERPEISELNPGYHNLQEADMDTVFNTGSLVGPDTATLRDILARVHNTYCGTIGAEYMHINETEQKRWIQDRLEGCEGNPVFDNSQKKRILGRVIAATALEQYLHTKYVGQKRFSLEGGESLIPLLDEIVQTSGTAGIKEVVIGMAHRGRINVLVNVVGKQPADLFEEFEGKQVKVHESGDVKYHLGYSSDIATEGGPVHLTLSFNPSHLEIIDPVVEGSVRARQERRDDVTHEHVLPVLIHGDAAFAGQGVVMETFNLSQTRGYKTGGTIHIIVNNQIGFTTSDPLDSRSTLYCTDVAKMVQAPIFHVNGDDPEAVVFIAELALEYRMTFKKDIVIDMVCYRKHGHSEADEPAATQPIMYQKIRSHKTVREIYTEQLIEEQVISDDDARDMENIYINSLESNQMVAGTRVDITHTEFAINFDKYKDTPWDYPVDTSLNESDVQRYTDRITDIPEDFELHPAVKKIMDNRKQMGAGEIPFDWGFAEHMAYASLLEQGHDVRISGQDSGRGTFFHRHAVIHNMSNGDLHVPLQYINDNQAKFLVINSTLSEEAVLAYEYGYSSAEPNALVIWEAQFGDFANGAQVVFDQFISSCEAKWGRYCGLVVMLPHGYDGQGPEHSSARLERFLQLCAKENMQVCVPSSASQMFHMLRRQVLRPYRKPLIIMSPKSLLRHKLSASPLQELTGGGFQLVIDEIDDIDPEKVTRLLFCAGKVYYDLLVARRSSETGNIAIARIEQLFPFPRNDVEAVIQRYPNLKQVVWVQEEPKNQGSWYYMQSRGTMLGCLEEQHAFGYAGRFYSASPATGHMDMHKQEQQQLIEDALHLDRFEESRKKSVSSA